MKILAHTSYQKASFGASYSPRCRHSSASHLHPLTDSRRSGVLCKASEDPTRKNAPLSDATVESALPSDAEVVPLSRPLLPSADSRFEGFKVLVAGSTGGVGRAVVRQLSEQGVPCRAMVRDGLRASQMLPSSSEGVEIVEGNVYNYRDCVRAMEGCNAVICCTGPKKRLDPFEPYKVDYEGNANLVAAAKSVGMKKFVLVTSIGCDDILFPLNALWGVLFWKKQGELALQRSGIDYTILRPGGLVTEPSAGRGEGGLIVGPPDTFGLPPRRTPGSVLRTAIAEGCIAALVEPDASCKVLEVIQKKEEPNLPWAQLFASIP